MSRETKHCVRCGEEIDIKAEICPKCGVRQPVMPELYGVSSAWYLVPLFFGIIGGLIAWFVNKDRDPQKARNFLIFGIVWSIVLIAITWILWAAIIAALLGGPWY